MAQDRIDPNAIQWTGAGAQKEDLDTRKGEAQIGSSQASAASSAASAARTRTLTPLQAKKEAALATVAELNAEKIKIALEKARRLTADRPPPEKLDEARRKVEVELKNALAAKQLSREMFGASGFGYTTTSAISGSPAATVEGLLRPIQANTAFTELKKMKAESPTGGALGATSDTEIKLLYSSEDAMDPKMGDEAFQNALDTIIGNRIELLNKLGADPYEIAALIPPEDRPLYKDRFKAYRFVPDDTKKIAAYVADARKNGTFDPTDFAALMGEAYYNATGRQPDEAFVTNAAKTGVQLASDPKAVLSDFDYTPADAAVRERVVSDEIGTKKKETGWGEALGGAAINFIPSTFELAFDTVKALTVDMPDTVEGIAKVIGGATGLSDDKEAWEALKTYYGDRYGTAEGFKQALRTDPASIAADIAGLFTGGATIVAKTAGVAGKVSKIAALSDAAKAAEGFAQFASKADPLAMAGKLTQVGGKIAEATGNAALNVPAKMAGVTTTDIKQAFGAGKRQSPEFVEQLEGTGDVMDPIAKAQGAITELYQSRSRDYTRRMKKMNKTEVLDWTDVEKAIDDVEAVGKHKGIDISSAADVWQEIFDIADQFKAQGLNTIEDFDAMKRAMSTIASKYQIGTPQNKVARDVAKKINDVIVQKAPVYANIMKDYRLASDTLSDITASISAGAKSADVTLGKLQRTAAGKGPRGRSVLDILEQTKSGKGLGDILAGQNLSGREASGFAPTVAGPASIAMGDPSPLAGTMITPYALGKTSYGLGSKYGMAERGAQTVAATPVAQRAAQLAAKYGPSAYRGVVAANPVIQSQVDPVTPQAQGMTEQAMQVLRQKYGTQMPRPVITDRSRIRLGDLASGYVPRGVSLEGISLDEEPLPEEEVVQEYARGGRVVAPLIG